MFTPNLHGPRRHAVHRSVVVGAVSLLWLALLPPVFAAGLFRAPFTPLDLDADPHVLALGDLNEDGEVDLIAGNFESGTVLVFLRERGVLGAASEFDAVSSLRHLEIFDMDADGHLDIVAGGEASPGIAVLYGDGNGRVGRPVTVTAWSILSMSAGELTGDGVADLAVLRRINYPPVEIIAGLGNREFAQLGSVTGSATQSLTRRESVVVHDLNGDGYLDMLIGDRDGAVPGQTVRLNQGDGTFARWSGWYWAEPRPVAIHDLNGDGHPDFVAGARIAFNDGTGFFADELDLAVAGEIRFLTTGDLDRDGMVDIVIGTDVLSVFLGDGAGGFALPIVVPMPESSSSAVMADATGDRRPDLIVADPAARTLAVIPARRAGGFGGGFIAAAAPGAAAITAADFDGDGVLDLAAAGRASDRVSVSIGVGDGTFKPMRDFMCGLAPSAIAAGDVTRDGRIDLVTCHPGLDEVSVMLGWGDGVFAGRLRFETGAEPVDVALTDLNVDGRLDMVVVNRAGHSLSVFLGAPGGTFATRRDIPMASGPTAIQTARLNADPIPDLIITAAGATVSALLGNGDGTFAPRIDIGGGGGIAVAVADLDHDRMEDLVVLTENSEVEVLIGVGGGVFEPAQVFQVAAGATAVAAHDLDLDGVVDLAVARDMQGSVAVRIGVGDGSFGEPLLFGSGARPAALLAGDFRGRGTPDLAVANALSSTVTVLHHTGWRPLPVPLPGTAAITLGAAFPNPARDRLSIPFTLVADAEVSVTLYDVRGRLVGEVARARFSAGPHVVDLKRPVRLAPGVYFYRLDAAGRRLSRPLVLR